MNATPQKKWRDLAITIGFTEDRTPTISLSIALKCLIIHIVSKFVHPCIHNLPPNLSRTRFIHDYKNSKSKHILISKHAFKVYRDLFQLSTYCQVTRCDVLAITERKLFTNWVCNIQEFNYLLT